MLRKKAKKISNWMKISFYFFEIHVTIHKDSILAARNVNIKEVHIMAHKINADACLSCGACASACPVDAITAGDDSYVINADTCIDCGACESECPAEAISAE